MEYLGKKKYPTRAVQQMRLRFSYNRLCSNNETNYVLRQSYEYAS
jgi:hypothetical protein